MLFSLPVCGQDSLQRTSFFEKTIPKHALKWSPFHAISFYPTLQVAYEQKLAERFTIQLDVGYVLTDWAFDFFLMDKYNDKRGLKVKLEGRYYHTAAIESRSVRYLSAEPYWNQIDFNRVEYATECLDRDCVSRYSRRYAYKVNNREKGIALKYGLMARTGTLLMDLNVGLSFRSISYRKPDGISTNPPNDLVEGNNIGLPNETNRFGLSPTGGIRVGFTF